VIGTTQLLLDSKTLNNDQTDMVETIRDCGGLLLALISDVLDLTKIEAGKFDLDEKVVSRPLQLRNYVVLT
jgi:signal transduction histidine kinase